MLNGQEIRLDHTEPGDSALRADLLDRSPFGTADIERFLGRLEVGKPAFDTCYDPDSRAVILMCAMPIAGRTVVTVRGFKNASREQYTKFSSEADPCALTGDMAVKLAAERILGVGIA